MVQRRTYSSGTLIRHIWMPLFEGEEIARFSGLCGPSYKIREYLENISSI